MKTFDVKTFITVVITLLVAYGYVVGKITTSELLPILTLVYGFYFAKKESK